ncbi:hypothetical protein JIN77_10295 [Verrucomicrobiaceae bacterium R5-34]|nr:hypothetical protein [Verrucomicrobiaceae bacterium R5-34]
MRTKKKLLGVLMSMALVFSSAHGAGFKGEVEFTDAEVESHATHARLIVSKARGYLQSTWQDHITFYNKNGVSKYYGDRSKKLNTVGKRRRMLRKYGVSPDLEASLKPTSCIGLTLNALEKGFKEPEDENLISAWAKIEKFTRNNGVDGTALVHALQKLGWRIYYWNPDPEQNEVWDKEEINWQSKGYHSYRYIMLKRKGTYYFNKVDDTKLLVGFGKVVPEEFIKLPFFVGVAHTGYHIFPGMNGEVIEAHSTRALNSKDNLEKSKFNPLGTGGGPRWTRTEKYRSGLIAVPPLK